jgi:hypothetical protein
MQIHKSAHKPNQAISHLSKQCEPRSATRSLPLCQQLHKHLGNRALQRVLQATLTAGQRENESEPVTKGLAEKEMILPYRKKGAVNFGLKDDTGAGLVEQEFTDSKKQPWIEQITLTFDGTKEDSNRELVATGTLKAVYRANTAALPDITESIVGGSLDLGSHACIHVDWNDLKKIQQINYHSVLGKTKVDVSYEPAALKELCCSRMRILGVKKKGHAPNPCQKEDPKACVK